MFNKNLQSRSLPVMLCIGLLLCVGALSSASCGKKGMPVPKDSSRSFAWKEVKAKVVGKCLAFEGSFEGAYQNFDGIRIEISQVNGPDDCPGCPFVAKEVTEFSPKETGFDPNTGAVSFAYCPQPANAYRWRLAGISKFNRLPHATMTDRISIVNQEAFAAESDQTAQEQL